MGLSGRNTSLEWLGVASYSPAWSRRLASRWTRAYSGCWCCGACQGIGGAMVCRSWQLDPPQQDIPKPLSTGHLYFLVFFAGHRRCGDIISWLEWQCDNVTPVPIDLAIDTEFGDARKCSLWADLIKCGRVLGGHFAPPCETYSDARWIVGNFQQHFPRPLRDLCYAWGMPSLSMRELKQLAVGTQLMWLAFHYMFLIWQFGGCASLEHPKGVAPLQNRFSVWVSSLLKRVCKSASWRLTTFLQGH